MSEKSKKAAIFICNGAIGHAKEERAEDDFYATEPAGAEWLLKVEPQLNRIWEPACGAGHLAEVFRKAGKLGAVSDLYDRGYHPEGIPQAFGRDFLQMKKVWKGDVVTNPPFSNGFSWAQHQLDLIEEGRYSALFMKLTFLEGKARRNFFDEFPPIRVWVSSSRLVCARYGDFENYGKTKATCYAWFVWQKGFKGYPEIRWFN